jgi:hypothetical protein
MVTSLLLTMATTKGSSVIQNVPAEQGRALPQQLPQPIQQPASQQQPAPPAAK